MITNIDYFYLLSEDAVIISEKNGPTLELLENSNAGIITQAKNHPYFCIAPREFFYYSAWVFENKHYADFGYYMNDDEFDDDSIINRALTPLEKLLPKFIFTKLEANSNPEENTYNIIELYNAHILFEYWLRRNRFSDKNQWKHLGLTERIFNLLPENHNYYDRNLICTCGHAECDNTEVWYIKYQDEYSVPFMINLQKWLVFNLHYFDNREKWQLVDYNEELFKQKDKYNNFPFCFEYKSFQPFEKTLQPNTGILNQ